MNNTTSANAANPDLKQIQEAAEAKKSDHEAMRQYMI